ncbi:hypothetical protein Tco_1301655 [Tanacetum coccineum]
MSSSTSQATATYTLVSDDSDKPSFGIPLVDVYGYKSKEPKAAPQSPDQAPLSPSHAPELLGRLGADEGGSRGGSSLLDSVSASKKMKPFEEDEVAPTPPSPTSHHHIIPLSHTLLRRERVKSTPLPSSFDVYIDAWRIAPASPLPPPSSLSPLLSPLPKIPSLPLLLPPPTRRDIIPEADMSPQKRARFAAPSHRFEIRESSAVAAARHPGSALDRGSEYGFVTALKEVNKRVTDLATGHRQDSHEFYIRHQDAQDDRVVLRARTSSLERER